jgi:hypothetical protein
MLLTEVLFNVANPETFNDETNVVLFNVAFPDTFNIPLMIVLFNNVVPLTCNDVFGLVVPIPTLPSPQIRILSVAGVFDVFGLVKNNKSPYSLPDLFVIIHPTSQHV